MSSITLRLVKGSPLTNAEVDANFSNLNTDKYQSGASPDFVDTLTDKLSLDTTAVVTPGVGEFGWDDGNGTASLGLKGGNVTLQLGQEQVVRVYNDSGVNLTDGQLVYISGAQGNRVAVKLAQANAEGVSAGTLGMVTEPILAGEEGFITTSGTVNGLNTSAFTQGAQIYLSATTAGAFTATKPVSPDHLVVVGWIERVHATVGSIFIKIDNGYELEELHDVLITSVATNDFVVRDGAVWKNKAPADARTAMGLGTAATANTTDFDPAGTAVALAIALG